MIEYKEDYLNSRKVMLGKYTWIWPVKKIVGSILAYITWKINRFGDKPHNNSKKIRIFLLLMKRRLT